MIRKRIKTKAQDKKISNKQNSQNIQPKQKSLTETIKYQKSQTNKKSSLAFSNRSRAALFHYKIGSLIIQKTKKKRAFRTSEIIDGDLNF